ncbi:chaperonin 10-like protein [Collybia nuda]|uniref:Chaperonin 10-like protein n=1 Tax=Collybia nuda TaxID=64659 RepID=A0A9P6C9P5_9AGAR|nr:chaperonin 10-like protein [Collybia nuda]
MATRKEMDAVCYQKAHNLEIITTTIPQFKDDQILIKVNCCGVCGTDHHIAEGKFIAKYPIIPGHEIVGEVSAVGSAVKGFFIGDRCVVNPVVVCDDCFHCHRGQTTLCKNMDYLGVTLPGGFSEYVAVPSKKVFKIYNISDEEAVLAEPTACAIHGLDKLSTPIGAEVLVIGAGPTGLVLSQLLKLNGASKIVIAANKGIKTRVARDLECGDEYVELDRENAQHQWTQLKETYPHGFDIVVEATGSAGVVNDAINYVRRGGTLLVYGVYASDSLVHWSPSKIFTDEIKIIGSFGQSHCFSRAVAYLESGKVRVKGMVTDVFDIRDFQKALDKLSNKGAVKVAIKPSNH